MTTLTSNAVSPIRCPACNATLGELRDGVVVVDLAIGHNSIYRRTILDPAEIRCGKPQKGGGVCPGVWPPERG